MFIFEKMRLKISNNFILNILNYYKVEYTLTAIMIRLNIGVQFLLNNKFFMVISF